MIKVGSIVKVLHTGKIGLVVGKTGGRFILNMVSGPPLQLYRSEVALFHTGKLAEEILWAPRCSACKQTLTTNADKMCCECKSKPAEKVCKIYWCARSNEPDRIYCTGCGTKL